MKPGLQSQYSGMALVDNRASEVICSQAKHMYKRSLGVMARKLLLAPLQKKGRIFIPGVKLPLANGG